MKGMRFPLHTILTALTLYFFNNTSTKAISQFFKVTSNISVSHVTISSWVHKFAHYFKEKANIFNAQLDLNSDDWHTDETVVFISGKKYYLCSETRFVLGFHLTQAHDFDATFILMNQAKYMGKPKNFITDRLPSYSEAVKTVLNGSTNIPVPPMSSDTNNNLIESFNKTFKAWYKAKKGLNY